MTELKPLLTLELISVLLLALGMAGFYPNPVSACSQDLSKFPLRFLSLGFLICQMG